MNRIQRLEQLGQSAWLDFLDHELLTSGELERMIGQDGIRGVTSNPTIFQKGDRELERLRWAHSLRRAVRHGREDPRTRHGA